MPHRARLTGGVGRHFGRSGEQAVSVAQRSLGLEDRRQQVLTLGTHLRGGQIGHALPVAVHGLGSGGEFGGSGRIDHGTSVDHDWPLVAIDRYRADEVDQAVPVWRRALARSNNPRARNPAPQMMLLSPEPVEGSCPPSGVVARAPQPSSGTLLACPVVTRPAVRDDLRALEGYHSAQVEVEVRLNTNESPAPPPATWTEALAEAVRSIDWHRYPDRQARALREALAQHHGVRPEQIFAANGSNEVLQILLLTFAGAGRTVATFEPTYQLHGHIARITGASTVEGERSADFTLDLDEVRRVVTTHRPHVTFLCSPNNPTGGIEPPDLVRATLAMEPGLLVVDEAYGQFADWSALELLDEERPLVVVRTFSKTWSMAAARLGYLVGPAWLVAELDKVTLPYHLDAVKQIAGRLALEYADAMNERVAQVVAERRRIVAAMGGLDIDVFPSQANFVLFRPRRLRGRALWLHLVERSVLVRDCSSWPRLDDCLRVTVGAPAENDAFLAAITEVCRP